MDLKVVFLVVVILTVEVHAKVHVMIKGSQDRELKAPDIITATGDEKRSGVTHKQVVPVKCSDMTTKTGNLKNAAGFDAWRLANPFIAYFVAPVKADGAVPEESEYRRYTLDELTHYESDDNIDRIYLVE